MVKIESVRFLYSSIRKADLKMSETTFNKYKIPEFKIKHAFAPFQVVIEFLENNQIRLAVNIFEDLKNRYPIGSDQYIFCFNLLHSITGDLKN